MPVHLNFNVIYKCKQSIFILPEQNYNSSSLNGKITRFLLRVNLVI